MNKNKKFISAMDDLKGLLDKEGININSSQNSHPEHSDFPNPDSKNISNELINDFEQDIKNNYFSKPESTIHPELNNDTISLDSSKPDDKITNSSEFNDAKINKVYVQKLKADLQIKLALQIEQSTNELKAKLLASVKNEIDQLFKK